jgi:hypothetical protein
VEAGNQPPNLQRIEARIGIVKVHPRVERDSHLAAVGAMSSPAPRTSQRSVGTPAASAGSWKCRALEQWPSAERKQTTRERAESMTSLRTTSVPAIPDSRIARDATDLEVALVTAGVQYDVLAEKLPGYVRPNFCAIIRGWKHST